MNIQIRFVLITLPLVLFFIKTNAQDGIILYEEMNTTFDLRELDGNQNIPISLSQIEKINSQRRSEKTLFKLYFKQNKSAFYFDKKLIPWLENSSDETLKSFYKNENQKKRQPKYFKDLSKQELHITGGSLPEDFMVEDDLSKLNKWKLMDADSIISGFKCNAAEYIGKENTIAWYTMDIPIANGPKHYSGLPGLIVAIKQENGSTISINRIEKMEIDNPQSLRPEMKPNKVTYKHWIEQFPPIPGF